MTSQWQPILEDELAARALSIVRAIGEALCTPRPKASPPLAHGLAGQALLQVYLARAGLEGGSFEAANALLDLAIVGLERQILPPDLFSGFLGVAWATEVLLTGEASDEEDPNEEIDEVLADLVERSPWRGDYDLIRGLVGFGVYAMKRLPRPSAARCLQGIVARLRDLAEPQGSGFTWLTRPDLMLPESRNLHPRGWYNLGVAHGIPGVVALLAKVCAADVPCENARPLLEGAVAWLLAQGQPEGAESTFPYYVDEHLTAQGQSGRSAWCYGDPGVAVCLLQAARSQKNQEWEQAALKVARTAARLPYENTGVVDAGLCHGAAGLGHIYNRLFQVTGEEVFLNAARYWLHRTIDMQQAGAGVAGYRSWSGGDEGQWIDDPGFLTGATGIGLALAAGVCRVEPTWDGALLMDLTL